MRIAEIGLNHDGDFDQALKLMRLAKEHNYDLVKFQKRSAGKWFGDATPRPDSPFGKTVGEHRHTLEFTIGQHELLLKKAHQMGLKYGCSIWDPIAAYEIFDLVQPGDIIKVGRPSNSELDLLYVIRQLYLDNPEKLSSPLIVSCRNKIEARLIKDTFRSVNNLEISILFCPGNYPDREKDLPGQLPDWADGHSLHHMEPSFGDHLGGKIIERHIAIPQTKHRDKEWSIVYPN